MKRVLVLVAVFIALIAFLGVACGDDDGAGNGSASPANGRSPSATAAEKTPDITPNETGRPSLTATPESGAATPTPKPPVLEPGITKIGEGTMTFTLLPEGEFPIDPLGLIQPGAVPPPCAAFVFVFSWQITNPFPPGSNLVVWRITNEDVTQDVGQGGAGTASVGCGRLTALNDGPDTITVSVWYIAGKTES